MDTNAIRRDYNVVPMSIVSSSNINAKTTQLIKHLTEHQQTGAGADKPTIVALYSKSKTVSKLISIVEIAKRHVTVELGANDIFEYSSLGSELVELAPLKPKDGSTDANVVERELDNDEDDDEDAFETMASNEKPKVRAIPTLTVYLSRTSVPVLKEALGEESL